MSLSAPGPHGLPLIGNFFDVRRDPIGTFTRAADAHGDVVRFRFGPVEAHLVTSAEGVRHVLQDNARNYGKQSRGFIKLRDMLGQGLLTSEGDFWLRQRRIAQPAFHRDKIAGFAEAMVRAGEEAVARLSDAASLGVPVDLSAEMMRVTLRIVAETLLGADMRSEAHAVGEALGTALEITRLRTMDPLGIPLWVPTLRNRRFLAARAILDGIVHRTIEARRRSGQTRSDLLGMLMDARDEETGEGMNNAQLRDEVMTIFLAGHETTANALTWTFYLLSRHPEARERLFAEVDGILQGRAPTLADLPRLPYARRVLDEAMRLFPPAFTMGRSVVDDDEILGYRIPSGTLVFVSPYATHRHRRYWPNPEGFDPERFLPGPSAERPRFSYFPFGGGPRLCIGQGFALLEAHLLLALLASRLCLDLAPGHVVAAEPHITLRPRGGMPMYVRSREP